MRTIRIINHPKKSPYFTVKSGRQHKLPLRSLGMSACFLVSLIRVFNVPCTLALGQDQFQAQQLRGSREPPGRRNLSASTRVVGGNQVIQPYPFFVEWGGCGGSLISEDMILTAAHCDGRKNPLRRRVHLGGRTRGEGIISRNIVKRISHPSYETSEAEDYSIAWDFLVAKLNETTTGIEGIEAIPLLNQDPNHPTRGETLTAMGFGKTHHAANDVPDIMRHVDIEAFSDEECDELYGNTRVRFERESMFCAGVLDGGKATCQGDSGGPLLDENGVQVGVVSWGEGCGAADFPDVYSRISAAHEWIQDQICRWSCYPPSTCSADIINECAKPQTPGQVNLTLRVVHDNYPVETAIVWEHLESATELFYQDFDTQDDTSDETVTLESSITNGRGGTYHLLVLDSARDGICCSSGQGNVSIANPVTGELFYFNNTFRDKLEVFFRFDDLGNVLWNGTELEIEDEEEPTLESSGGDPATTTEASQTEGSFFDPSDDPLWPGEFPITDSPSMITINIQYDDFPLETSWVLERKTSNLETPSFAEVGGGDLATGDWAVVEEGSGAGNPTLFTTPVDLQKESLYRFTITDETWQIIGDGICCDFGQGWATLTNGTASKDNPSGTVMWVLPGDNFTSKAEAYLWVDSNGLAGIADYTNGYSPAESLSAASASVQGSEGPDDPIAPEDASSSSTTPLAGDNSVVSGMAPGVADPEEGNNSDILDIPVVRTSPLYP